MTHADPQPICAFFVSPDGACGHLDIPHDPTGLPFQLAGYGWMHFDLSDPAFDPWLRRVVPDTIAKALTQSETRPRCDRIENGVILTLRGVNLNPGSDPDDMVSIRIWVGEGVIISTRMRKVIAIDSLRAKMAAGTGPESIPAFLAELVYGLTKRIEKVSLELAEATDELEERALDAPQNVAADLAHVRLSVIKLRRFVRPQNEALSTLASGEVLALDPRCEVLLNETSNRTTRTVEELDATSDRLQAISDHLDVTHSLALGRNSYVLSVVAAIFLPLGFLTGLFGINVGGMPGIEAANGFWLVTSASVLIGFALIFVFRWLKWL